MRGLLAAALFLSPGLLKASCNLRQTLAVGHASDTYIGCTDSQRVGMFAALISNPTGVNSNGQNGVCTAADPTQLTGGGTPCQNPNAGVLGDNRLIVQYDWGSTNPGSLGCPVPSGGADGDAPLIVEVVSSDGSSAIIRTGYSASAEGYAVDYSFPLNPDGETISNIACRPAAEQSIRVDSATVNVDRTVQVDLTVFLPHLESDCSPDTAGPFVGTCPQGADPVLTRGRLFYNAACGGISSPALGTLSPVQPDAAGHVHVSLPYSDSGCWSFGSTYAFDGHEIPVIPGYQTVHTPLRCVDADDDSFLSCNGDCDDNNRSVHPFAAEVCNAIDDDCDGLVDEDGGPDANGADLDHDGTGDRCDLDDGLILVDVPDRSHVAWQKEAAFASFNLYRGDLAVLRSGGDYTQDPATVPLASHSCGVTAASAPDDVVLAPGQAVFYLVTGIGPTGEGTLGTDSAGNLRPNTHPCP